MRPHILGAVLLALTLVTRPSAAQATAASSPQAASSPFAIELTSLRLMHEKHVISDAEYESAIHDLAEASGSRAPDGFTLLVGKVATTFYGFVEFNAMYDTTQSFSDLAANGQVARAESFAGSHGRTTFSIRDSRFGFRMKPPAVGAVRTSANLEMDFYGPSLPIGGGQPYSGTEAGFFVNPALRVRQANMKIETPIVDFLIGQYWNLFGWAPTYLPNSVELQGLPGQLFGRAAQIRVSKTLKSDGVSLELAIAALRPPQRDSSTPDLQAGVKLSIDHWEGAQTLYAPSTVISPASIAVSGVARRLVLPEFTADPKDTHQQVGQGIALNAFIPVIPASKANRDNALSLVGEFVTGKGINDLYTGLVGGVANPALPNPTNATPAPTYAASVDPGLAVYDATGEMHLIQWTTYFAGLQYYLPGVDGRLWVSANYSHSESSNARIFGAPTKTRLGEDWFDACLFGDATPQVRLGIEYGNFNDEYGDGHHAINHKVQLDAFYVF